jgi:hypothetical protein
MRSLRLGMNQVYRLGRAIPNLVDFKRHHYRELDWFGGGLSGCYTWGNAGTAVYDLARNFRSRPGFSWLSRTGVLPAKAR